MNQKKAVQLVLWIISFQIIGILIGIQTQNKLYPWYQTLVKSPYTPPDAVFGIVWPILYVILAITGWAIYTAPPKKNKQLIFILFSIQMLINWSWTPVFFGLQAVGIALFLLILLVILTIFLFLLCLKFKPWIAYLLIPYLLWISFASYLNAYIWWF